MLGLKRLIRRCSCLRDSIVASLHTTQPEKLHYSLPSHHLAHLTPKRFFLNFHQLGNRAAIEKECTRLEDEMNRGAAIPFLWSAFISKSITLTENNRNYRRTN